MSNEDEGSLGSTVGRPLGEDFVDAVGKRRRFGLVGWLDSWGDHLSLTRRRRVGSAVVAAVGFLVVAVPLYHLSRHAAPAGALLGDVLPVVFGAGLLYTSLRLRSCDGDAMPLVTAFWVGVGFLVAGAVSLYFLVLHSVHGHVVDSPWFLTYNMAATGAMAGLLISRYDVRARRRNRRLSRQERRFRAVFEGTLDALVITDDEGRYVAANPAAADLFGLPRTELIGKRIADFAADDVDVESEWSDFLKDGGQRGEFELHRPDGEVRTAAFAATANVLPGYHLSALRDVTERSERERELAEERARVEFLNQLLRHNILNGMNLVLAKLDALEPRLSADQQSDLHVARHRSQEIVDLVQTARRLAKGVCSDAETGQVDLVGPLSTAVETVRETYPAATVEFAPPDGEIRVRADDSLRTVFDHLLTNTVEHNDAGDLTVSVDVRVSAETVTVVVADDGVGISAERRDELFGGDSFSHTRDWGGFGLAIVDVLVREYGGEVWAEDNDPTGVAFHVELRRADAE